MLPRNQPPDWNSMWAGLLQGIGAGLLHYDGSPLAQAALKGLQTFDSARERRGPPAATFDPDQATIQPDAQLPPEMSVSEIAAFQRLSPEEQADFLAELAAADAPAGRFGNSHGSRAGKHELPENAPPSARDTLPAARRLPASASPFEGWLLEPVLPFARKDGLRLPAGRR